MLSFIPARKNPIIFHLVPVPWGWKSLFCRLVECLLVLFSSRCEFSIRRIFHVYLGVVVDVAQLQTAADVTAVPLCVCVCACVC